MPDYIRGENITLIANYLDGNSSPILTGVSGVNLDIYYYTTSGTKNFYVQSGTMVQSTGVDTNRFIYGWTVPLTTPITNHVADYRAMYSGINVQYSDIFGVTVIPASTGIYVGATHVSGTIITISGTGINGASVMVSNLVNGVVLTSTATDISGNYSVYLDDGNYLVLASAAGYASNSVAQTVPTGLTSFLFAPISLVGGVGTGSILISDTYQWIDQNDGGTYGLENLKVSLYVKTGSNLLTQPIGTTRTDVSGTFTLNAADGEYVLRIEGNGPNNTVYNTCYDIEVSDAYSTSSPLGFRYEGTSQYAFL
jgi:hypothetical protein